MLGAATQVEVGHVAAVHTFLNREVEHGFLLAILDTSDTRLIALLIVELHVLDDAHGDILECRLDIAQHKLLTIQQNLLNLLTVDGDVAILIYLGTRNTLDELLDRRALGSTVGLRVIQDGILFNDDLCGTTGDNSLLQHDTLGFHEQVAQILISVTTQRYLAFDGLVAYRRDFNAIGATGWGGKIKITSLVTNGAAYKSAVGGGKQLDGSLYHRFLQLGIAHLSADSKLSVLGVGLRRSCKGYK